MEVKTVYTGGRRRYPIRSVTKMTVDSDGTVTRMKLGGRKSKRKVSKQWRQMDKMLRRMSRAQETAASDYRRRHTRSNKKKKNGAIRDLNKNMWRAQRKGFKKLKIGG